MAKPLLLGIEIGGTKLQVGLGHGDGTILELRRAAIDPAAGAGAIREQIVEMADRACWTLGLTREAIAAVGVGFGGPVDADRGVVTTSHHVAGWDGFPLADWCREQLRRRRRSPSRTTPTPPGWARPASAPARALSARCST